MTTEKIDLLSASVLIEIPVPIHKDRENYEEGVIYTYSFNDGGVIIIHEGALMQFDIDTYKPLKLIQARNTSIAWGKEDNKYWKRFISKRVRLYYYNVNMKYKRRYDCIFRNIKKQLVNMKNL